jgi:hypothetical protein
MVSIAEQKQALASLLARKPYIVAPIVLVVLLVILFAATKQTPKQKPTNAIPVNHFIQNAAPFIEKGVSLPPEYLTEEHEQALLRLRTIFVSSNADYLKATTTNVVQSYLLQNTERLFAYNNYQKLLAIAASSSPEKGVWILPVSTDRYEFLYYISRPIVVDLVNESGITKLDYLTPIRECETRNKTLHAIPGVKVDCSNFAESLIQAANKAH